MQINTTARHCELDPETREFVEQRLGRLQKYARDIQEVNLTVTAEKFRHTAEIAIKLKSNSMVSREESTEPRVAIDLAADHIERQLRRLKDKRVDRKRHATPLNGLDRNAPVPSQEFSDEDAEAGEV